MADDDDDVVDDSQSGFMQLYQDSKYSKANKYVSSISAGLNTRLSAGEKILGLSVPIADYGEEATNDLQRDIFWHMFLAYNNRKEEIPEDREVNAQVLDWVTSDPGWKRSVLSLTNQRISAASAAYVVTEKLMEIQSIKKAMKMQAQADKAQNDAESLENDAFNEESGQGDENQSPDENQEQGDNPDADSQDRESPEEMRAEADRLRQKADNLRQKAKQQVQEAMGDQMNSFARGSAVKQGSDFGDKVHAFLSSWGINEGRGYNIPPEEVRNLMNMLSGQGLSQLTMMMGRILGIANKVIAGRSNVALMVDTGGITKDIHDIHPAELWRLSTENPLRDEAIREFLEDGLEGVVRTSESKQEGIFIGGVDTSGSTDASVEGANATRALVLKSLALGMARAARQNGQEYALFQIGGTSETEGSEVITHVSTLAETLRWAGHGFGNGTDLDAGLIKAMNILEEGDEESMFKSDIFIGTDGEADIFSSTISRLYELKERYGVRLFILMVGVEPRRSVLEAADKVFKFTNMDEIATTLAKDVWDVDGQRED